MRVLVDGLASNWAYMVITSLAWNMKAWYALSLPSKGRWKEKRMREKKKILRMEFKKFRNYFIMLPGQPNFRATTLQGTLVLGLDFIYSSAFQILIFEFV